MSRIKPDLARPQDRIMALVGLLVVLLSLAIGVTVWRYGAAEHRDAHARAERHAELMAERAHTALAHQNGLADAYGGDKDPEDLVGLKAAAGATSSAALAALEDAPERADRLEAASILDEARALHRLFEEIVVPVAGTPQFDDGVKPFARRGRQGRGEARRSSAARAPRRAGNPKRPPWPARTRPA